MENSNRRIGNRAMTHCGLFTVLQSVTSSGLRLAGRMSIAGICILIWFRATDADLVADLRADDSRAGEKRDDASLTAPQVTPAAPIKSEATGRVASEGAPSSAISPDEANELIQSLGAITFAERERAMGEILRIGAAMAPYLRSAIESEQDPELLLRAKTTLSQMTLDDLESRVEIFLSGSPDSSQRARQWFEGWKEVETAIGDSPAIRELFVEVMKAHPAITKSLTGTTADRTAAAQHAAASIQVGMLERRQAPSLADGVAMLLPLTDAGVQIGGGYESTVLSVFNRHYGALRRDAQLWPPVSSLLELWILRSRIESRVDVLWYAMQWDLAASGQLALRTLEETTDVETVQTALQAISRFRTSADAPRLARWLSDDRPAITRMEIIQGEKPLKVAIADTALATLAILYKVPFKEIGMRSAELHPKVGFLIDNAGYTADQSDERAAAIERAQAWCEGKLLPGPPRS